MKKSIIPFFSLERHIQKIEKPCLDVVAEIFRKQSFIGGKFVEEFEAKLGEYLGLDAQNVVACNSGTDGLWLALKALGCKKDSLVLTTAFSFIASASEIASHGGHPVFIDIDPTTYNIDPKKIRSWLQENAILKNGKAVHKVTGLPVEGIIVVDLYGQCANYDEIVEIANEWHLWIIEDACQAIGAQLNGKQAGTFGHIGVYSFYPTKNLGAFGDGGCVVSRDAELAATVRQLKNHGRKSHYNYESLGINSRLDAMQAAFLTIKLGDLDTINQARHDIAQKYEQAFSKFTGVITPKEITGKHVYHQYCVTFADNQTRQAFIAHLDNYGIGYNFYYPQALTEIDFLNTHKDLVNACPVSAHLPKTILALPIWPELNEQEITYICSAITQFEQTITPAATKVSQLGA
ncbi:MAG: DegT/DnrJ/EryC1/StrS family aminotransferase [bacterium]